MVMRNIDSGPGDRWEKMDCHHLCMKYICLCLLDLLEVPHGWLAQESSILAIDQLIQYRLIIYLSIFIKDIIVEFVVAEYCRFLGAPEIEKPIVIMLLKVILWESSRATDLFNASTGYLNNIRIHNTLGMFCWSLVELDQCAFTILRFQAFYCDCHS